MIGARTRARELALQALYTRELVEHDPEGAADATLLDAEVPEGVRRHARDLYHGVVAQLHELDAAIRDAADNWELKRLATVDRNVLRLALHEMLHLDDVPPRVAINEAIELGKRFSTAQSGAFINGVLDAVRKQRGLPAGDAAGDAAASAADAEPPARPLSPGAPPQDTDPAPQRD